MNLAQMANRFYQDMGEPDTNRFTIDLLKEWFDEAEYELNTRSKLIKKESLNITGVSNQRAYNLPADILDFNVDNVFYSIDGSSDKAPLEFIDEEQLKVFDPFYMTRNGLPTHFYIDEVNSKYCLYPYEQTMSSTSNKISLYYRGKHTKMTHYYVTGTASIAIGATAVTGGSTAWTGNVSALDKFGIGKMLDASRVTSFPAVFYTVSTVGGDTSITLSSSYAEVTASSAYYICCSDSSLANVKVNLATVEYVKGLAYKKDGEHELAIDTIAEAIGRAEAEANRIENQKKCTFASPQGTLTSRIKEGFRDYGNY